MPSYTKLTMWKISFDGYNSLNSNKIIALARIPSIEKTSEWKQFELPFEYKKAIDESALKEGKYKLAVVFSSSINGAEFKGSVGKYFVDRRGNYSV